MSTSGGRALENSLKTGPFINGAMIDSGSIELYNSV